MSWMIEFTGSTLTKKRSKYFGAQDVASKVLRLS